MELVTDSHFNVDSDSESSRPVVIFRAVSLEKRFGSGLSGIFPRAGDYCETQADAGVTSERPDTGLNSPFQVGRITSGFARR